MKRKIYKAEFKHLKESSVVKEAELSVESCNYRKFSNLKVKAKELNMIHGSHLTLVTLQTYQNRHQLCQ